MRTTRQRSWLWAVLALGAIARLGYVGIQPGTDPNFARPILDGAYYLDWARHLISGTAGADGAYYLAPGYPFFLAGWLGIVGERFAVLYIAQHAMAIGAAAFLAVFARRRAGELAGIATAVLVLGYHPLLYFGSRPVGETLAILLVAAALVVSDRATRRHGVMTGLLLGAASVVRPNLLPVPLLWGAVRRRRGIALVVAAVGVVVPIGIRNLVVSGHAVPVSSNAGITLYHGNGPAAEGIYTPIDGFSGAIGQQRAEATAIASTRVGRPLDDVEADRWWGAEAVRVRGEDPAGSLALLGRRFILTFGNREHGLDYAPRIDANPLRFAAPVPFAAVLALAVIGVVARGWKTTGGWEVWSTIAVAAATPVVFYVSSRYRVPLAVFLCIPAGVGASTLIGAVRARSRRVVVAASVGVIVALASGLAPDRGLARSTDAGALANRALGWLRADRPDKAMDDARLAVSRGPDSAQVWFNAGVVFAAGGQSGYAETAYLQALAADSAFVPAAANLASMWIPAGRSAEAVPLLESAVAARSDHRVCWVNLVVAYAEVGNLPAARDALDRAAAAGVEIDAGLQAAIEGPNGVTDR